MNNKYWFRPKLYGYGFFPISWEGWFLTFLLAVLIISALYANNMLSSSITPSLQEIVHFFLDMLFIIFMFHTFSEEKNRRET